MPDQNRSDVREILDEREELKGQISSLRERLQEADAGARKVPALEREREKLEKRLGDALGKLAGRAEENGKLEQRVRELESELRDQGELEGQLEQATAAVAAAQEQNALQDADLQSAVSYEGELRAQIGEQAKEIERLEQIEEAAKIASDDGGLKELLS
jgi:chromosome segregation ATPase